MKSKILLLFLLLIGGLLNAQDTIRTLLITEARCDRNDKAYVELTNVGDFAIQLSDFEFGSVSPYEDPYTGYNFRLPEKMLQPGESFTLASVMDFIERQHFVDPDHYGSHITKKEWWDLADVQVHLGEQNGDETDSVSVGEAPAVFTVWNGTYCWYIEQHLSETDSVVVDQVLGVFDSELGRNAGPYDVAGVTDATVNSVLIRQFRVKMGNDNFADSRGIGVDDSEWNVVPFLYASWEPNRALFWTAGNHGDYNLDETTLESDVLEVDWANKIITAPWGTRNNDDFMMQFKKKPGLAWHYDLSTAREDSAYFSARTGDQITIYASGIDLDVETFSIVVAEPTTNANKVVPKYSTEGNGFYGGWINAGEAESYWVTENAPGMDSITYDFYGIPFATEADTLIKYLEKAPNANWEFVWVDGVARTAVQNGDKLKVTAENGDVKEYFIKVNGYRPSHDAYLSSITWPDIPEFYKGIFGWEGDTIPSFGPASYSYKVSIPADIDGIPALIGKKQALNSSSEVKRATSLSGSLEQKTISFTVTAEDKTTVNTYSVQLEKEKNPQNIQPFIAEPFISEHYFQDQYANGFVEICNPGNQPLDLSNYIFIRTGNGNPAEAIVVYSGTEDWMNRYYRYVPGYKWVGEEDWVVTPGILEQDLNVNSIILPGDVFVMGHIKSTGTSGYPWFVSDNCDVITSPAHNPWNEETTTGGSAARGWWNTNFYIFKIKNDSVKLGLKQVIDPNDFELIETFGMKEDIRWIVGGIQVGQVTSYIRKPEYYIPKTGFEETFGTTPEDSEWRWVNQSYWQALNYGYPASRLNNGNDIGKHFLNEITIFKSTVTSVVYKVSPGYSMNESIRGLTTGITVANFLNNVVKADENQTLKMKASADGSELAMDAVINLNDILEVLSADSINTTNYVLEVSENGLSSNAVLSSAKYDVTIVSEPKSTGNENAGTATISDFEYGTSLKTIIANINVPPGASLDMVDGNGAYVSLKMLNFDTTYVNVTVNANIYFDVVAENGTTEIIYQLIPDVSDNDAFITSDVYAVVQKDLLIHYVPRGTSVDAFLANIVPSARASIKLVDKLGRERMAGKIVADDKIVVTSANGLNSTAYFIAFLRTQYILEPTYLAYIQSVVYGVDQVNYKVNGVSGAETVADVLSNVKVSQGATAIVVDENLNDKPSGNINGGDLIMVTSADGKIEVYYTFGPLTGVNVYESNGIDLYPNPTSGKINVSGVKAGYLIHVYNSVGSAIRVINVQSSLETISLDNQPAGMYLIVISDQNKMLGRYKALRK